MNDSEIIKALECCAMNKCDKCSIKYECRGNKIRATVIISALDLIKRQKAEITKMNGVISYLESAYTSVADEVKVKTVQEFAERLKRKSELVAPSVWAIPYRAVAVTDIDKLLEEMGCNDG